MTVHPTPLADQISRDHRRAMHALRHPWLASLRYSLATPTDDVLAKPLLDLFLGSAALFFFFLGFLDPAERHADWLAAGASVLLVSGLRTTRFLRHNAPIARGELRVTVLSSSRIDPDTRAAVDRWDENGAIRLVHVAVVQFALTAILAVKRQEVQTSLARQQEAETRDQALRRLSHGLLARCIPGYVPIHPLPPRDKEMP